MPYFLKLILITCLISCNDSSKSNSTGGPSDPIDGIQSGQQRLFLTSTTYNGNLGGLSGADVKCQNEARAAGLRRTYKAFLSSSTILAKNRFSLDEPLYEIDPNGDAILIAQSLTDFNNGNVLSDPAFRYDQNRVDQNVLLSTAATFWIATGSGSVNFCTDWTSSNSNINGNIGSTNSGEILGWMETLACDQQISLICISDS